MSNTSDETFAESYFGNPEAVSLLTQQAITTLDSYRAPSSTLTNGDEVRQVFFYNRAGGNSRELDRRLHETTPIDGPRRFAMAVPTTVNVDGVTHNALAHYAWAEGDRAISVRLKAHDSQGRIFYGSDYFSLASTEELGNVGREMGTLFPAVDEQYHKDMAERVRNASKRERNRRWLGRFGLGRLLN